MAPLVRVVAPEARAVAVYRPNGSARRQRGHEDPDGADIHPGLTIPLSGVFA